MKLEVTGCKDCPFQYDWQVCTHPNQTEEEVTEDVFDFIDMDGSPYWCPLKQEPITIEIIP